jgi:tetratricopeptide (TPR) repeat protein
MNLNVDLCSIEWKRVRPARTSVGMAVVVLLFAAGAFGYWHHINNPPKPWLVRWKLQRYLAKNATSRDFKVAFAFPSKAEMAAVAAADGERKGSRTGKTYDAARDAYLDVKTAELRLAMEVATNSARAAELQRAEQESAMLKADLWEFNRRFAGIPDGATVPLTKARAELVRDVEQKLAAAPTYAAIYHLIGQELWVADRLLESKNVDHRREGMQLALAASRHALDPAVNGWVAARICEGYLLPNLDAADEVTPRSPLSFDNLVRQCANLFGRNEEYPNAARVYEMCLAKAANATRADWARYQIADAYQQGGDPKTALTYLKQVQNTNDNRLNRRIAFLQRQVATQ